ncbi:MAG: YdcF family protein [Clostridia bacterium]|nr:YdcF family protein [Clostridia bacterium]
MKTGCKAALGVLAGTAGYFLVTAGAYLPFVAQDARKQFDDDCEYLLILGGDILGEDTPSPQLQARMERAAAYLKAHPQTVAVPCGGNFRPAQRVSEAEVIARYLIAQGIDPARLLPEDRSTTTYENFQYSLPLIRQHSGKEPSALRIGFLTSSYHMHRAACIAARRGLPRPLRVTAPTPGAAWKRYVREYFVAYELLYHW